MNDTHQRSSWSEVVQQAFILVLLLAVAFPAIFLKGETLVPGSSLYEVNPWRAYGTIQTEKTDRLTLDAVTAIGTYYALVDRTLKHGEWPLWNALELAGIPLLANCQSAVFYPPRLIHAVLDLPTATTIYILLKLWLCGMTAYACARVMGLRRPAAQFASVGWMLCTYNLIWCYWPLPDVSAWTPIIVLGIEFILGENYKRGFPILAIGGTLSLLAGHPETAFVYGAGAGTYFSLRLVWERRWGYRLVTPIAVVGAAWTLALLVAAAQLIPFIEYAANMYELRLNIVNEPGSVAALWIPRFFGLCALKNFWGRWDSNRAMMVYAGIATWLCIGLLFTSAPNSIRTRARIACLTISSAVFALLAFDAPPLQAVNTLPVFNALFKTYNFAWAIFGLVFLGAIGLDRWLSRVRRIRESAWMFPMAALAVAIVAWCYWFNHGLIRASKMTEFIQREFLLATLFATLAYTIVAAFSLRSNRLLTTRLLDRRAAFVGAALTAVLAADLITATRDVRPTCPADRLFVRTDLTDCLLALKEPTRISTATALIPSGILPVYGIEEWTGYDGIYPERIKHFQKELAQDVWNAMEPVCAVEYYLHDMRLDTPMFPRDEKGTFDLVATHDGIEVYKNTAAFPRAFLVPKATVAASTNEMFDTMRRKDFKPAEEVLLEEAPLGVLPETSFFPLGTAILTERSSLREVVETDAAQPCMLVLSEGFFPGWKATIDEQPAKVLSAYYAFRTVYLPAGKHTVVFSYKPLSFTIGMTISIITLTAITITSCVLLLRRRRHIP